MSRTLPPLSAELGMTQAAVSYQIRLLEERVGAPLFLRGPRRIALSDAGRRFAPAASEALDALAAGYASARGIVSEVLSIGVVPTFAACWLARHLGEFHVAHPGIAVRIALSTEPFDFAASDIDLAIHGGRRQTRADVESHLLLDAAFTPMLSPALAGSLGGLATPADLLRCPLVSPGDSWWGIWFAAAGVPWDSPRPNHGWGLGTQHLESVAAMAGQGAAVLTPFFYREDVAQGRLVQPFDIVCRDEFAYQLSYPRNRRNLAKVRLFRDWLLGRFAEVDPAFGSGSGNAPPESPHP